MTSINGISDEQARTAANQARRAWAKTEAGTDIAHRLSEATAKAIVERARRRYDKDDPNADVTKRVLTDTLHCVTSGPYAESLPDTQEALEEAKHPRWQENALICHFFNLRGRPVPFTVLRGGKYKGDDNPDLDNIEP